MNKYEEYHHLGVLITKYLKGGLSETEASELRDWRQSDKKNEELFVRLTSEQNLLEELVVFSRADRRELALKNIKERTVMAKSEKETFSLFRYVRYAAALMFLVGVGYLLFLSGRDRGSSPMEETQLLPASDRAILILGDGREIDLDQAMTGEIARQEQAVISKSEDGFIAYQLTSLQTGKDETVKHNTIATPKGGKYRLQLPDGSRVWLNAASSLRFPTRFDRRERLVELKGEAFFEVAHNQGIPFRVISGKQSVEVLGTEFNVNGYSEEGKITTTLVSGKVKVGVNEKGTGMSEGVTLLPGQKSLLANDTEKLQVSDADMEESIAWKNGKFVFNDTDLGTIMRELSRWYDLQVEFRDDVQNMRFRAGMSSRDVPASQVLEILKSSGINIKTEGRKIIISS